MSDGTSETRLSLSPEAVSHLSTMGKWGLFLAIMGFIGAGICILMGMIVAVSTSLVEQYESFGPMVAVVIGLFYIVIGGLYFLPAFHLFRFSTRIKTALLMGEEHTLTASLSSLRFVFVFYGIMTIAVIVMVILAIVAVIVFSAMAASAAASAY